MILFKKCIITILTSLDALAYIYICTLAIYLACTLSNKIRHATFQSRYHRISLCTIYIHRENPSFVTFPSSFSLGTMGYMINNDEA